MLLYYSGVTHRRFLFLFGSMFYKGKIIGVGLLIASVTVLLQLLQDTDQKPTIGMPHQYPHQVLGSIVSFALVFRINQAWNRYWEAISQLHFMYSKWADSFSQFCAFISVTILKIREQDDNEARENEALLEDMRDKVENDFLLLSAMACDRICRGDCNRMERRWKIRHASNKLVVLREDLRKGDDGTGFKNMPKFKVSQCSRWEIEDDEKLDDIEMKDLWEDATYVVRKPPKDAKYELLKISSDRCNMVVNWLNHNLAYCSSMLDAPAPIQSRMYQEISNGMLGFNNVMKIADVPFAFPYDQIILLLLLVWIIFIPFYVMSFTESLIAGPVLAFLLTTFMLAMNHAARELENPFGLTPNKICVPEFHSRFCLVVRDAVRSSNHPPRPPKAKAAETKPRSKPRWTTFDGDDDSFHCLPHFHANPVEENTDLKIHTLTIPDIPKTIGESGRSRSGSGSSCRTDKTEEESHFGERRSAENGELMASSSMISALSGQSKGSRKSRLSRVSFSSEIVDIIGYKPSPHEENGVADSQKKTNSNVRRISQPMAGLSASSIDIDNLSRQIGEVSERFERHLSIISGSLVRMSSQVGPRELLTM